MTYPELLIALDIGDPKTVLSSICDPCNIEDLKYCGCYFIVCDNGDVHCFDMQGREQKIEYIPRECFANQSFKKIIIPETAKSIGASAFRGCKGLKSITIPNIVKRIESSTFSGCTSLTSVTIGNRVTHIRDWAFYDCTSLTSMLIPNNVTYIGYCAFEGCKGLMDVTIGKRVTRINAHAFFNCHKLKSLVFKGKTLEQVESMVNYPWGITDMSIIQAGL